MVVHHFDPKVNSDGAEWWSTVYRRAFPDYVTHDLVSDVALQKAGIDHRVHLRGGGELLVDVKVREQYWPDVAVEVWSDKQRRRPGWVLKSLRSHYVAYAFPSAEVAVLLPFHLLQLAYQQNKHEWAALAKDKAANGFREVNANNGTYTTLSVAVPIDRLCQDVAAAMTVYFHEDGRPF